VSNVGGRPHVLQVAYSLDHGGSERLACDLAIQLRPEFQTSVVAIEAGGALEGELTGHEVPWRVIGRRSGFDWRVSFKLYRLFRHWRPEVIVTHHLMELIYAGIPARLAGATLVHIEHEYFSLRTRAHQLGMLSKLCSAVVVPGEAVRRFVCSNAGVSAAKVFVIPNSVDTARYAASPRVGRHVFGLSDRMWVVGNVARFDRAKDHETLIRAFKIVRDEQRDVKLALVGDGALRHEVRSFAEQIGVGADVEFFGARDDVADILPNLDAFALSSVEEGVPMALLEAMACARPVVATNVGGIPGIVVDGQTGRLVGPRDAPALARALLEIMRDPDAARRMGVAARKRIEDQFGLAASVQRYAELFAAASKGFGRRHSEWNGSCPSATSAAGMP
jgi:glycosyltransferase involved in cell wall biosynthesis